MRCEPTARGRLLCSLLATGGACICSSAWLLAAAYIVGMVPTVILARVAHAHCRFVLIVVTPVAAMSLLVWPVMMGAPPGELAGSNPSGAFAFALLTVFRLAFVGGIFQAALLSLDPARLTTTLWKWGVRGEWLVVVLAAVVLGPEMKRRADRVITAASARGMLKSRRVWHRIGLAVASIVPLTAWGLRSAVERADTWHQRKMLDRIELVAATPESGYVLVNVVLIVLSGAWLVSTVATRLGLEWP